MLNFGASKPRVRGGPGPPGPPPGSAPGRVRCALSTTEKLETMFHDYCRVLIHCVRNVSYN